jgi:hypothetical protein
MPSGDREPRRVPYHILQVVEPPRPTGDGSCLCKLFQDREAPLPSSSTYRCLKLGATRAPLRLRVTRPIAALVMPLQVRRQGFQGEDATLVRGQTDESGIFDTVKLGEPGIFDQLALVTIDLNERQSIRVPVPLIDQQYVVIPLAAAGGEGDVSRFRLEGWIREISDSILVQNNLFKELKTLSTSDAKQRAVAMDKARAGLERTKRDHQRMSLERDQLEKDNEVKPLINAQPAVWNQAKDRLVKIKQAESELENYVAQLDKIDREEKSPQRQKWLAEVERARLLERDADVAKAIEIYESVLNDGYPSEQLKKHVEGLKKAWVTEDEDLKLARGFIYNVWPTLDNRGLKERLLEVRTHFDVCKKKRDVWGPRRLLNSTIAHALRMEKELQELKPQVNVDDEKPAELIKELSPGLEKLVSDIDVFLKSIAGA